MSDYKVGSSGSKDKYMVGWNKSESKAYKVGGRDSQVESKDSGSLGGGDQASPAGAKSQFSHVEKDVKDIGDKSPNMNFGGAVKVGIRADMATEDYSEKGDWSDEKNAMARRKGMMDFASKYSNSAGYETPTSDFVNIKK